MSILDTLITNRTQADVDELKSILAVPLENWSAETLAEFNLARSKGSYNYTDLNRVTQAMDYINNQLVGYGYATGYQKIKIPRKGGGRLPEGYTELEYIQSSGTQYIDTGFKPNQDTRVVINVTDVSASSGIASLFGGRTTNGVSSFSMWAFSSVVRTDYGANILKTTQPYATVQSIDKNKNITILNGTEYTQTYSTFQAGVSLTLFAVNDGEIGVDNRMVSMCLYSCQIYDNGTLIRDYVPASSSSGTVGLYDTVNGVFYQNAGSGAFTAGPEVVVSNTDESLDPYTWYESDVPTSESMAAYLANVAALRGVLDILPTTPETPESMEALTWVEANNIEQILIDVQTVLTSLSKIFLRAGMVWAVSGGPGFYFTN